MSVKKTGDIDIDFANRTQALAFLEHIPASIIKNNDIERHNTGVYFHAVPVDPWSSLCSFDYKEAEERGFYKFDLLNVHVYENIKSETHLCELIDNDIDWTLFEYPEFNSQLIHIGNHANLVAELKPKNISNLAFVLALIRPGKKYLIESCKQHGFDSIADEIWIETQDSYSFKSSHAHSYALLVKVHAGLLIEKSQLDQ
jgi:DNA polymerase III alpha subunit